MRIFIDAIDYPFFVEFSCFGGSKGKATLSNGDPGVPDDPLEIDTITVSVVDGGEDIYDILRDDIRERIEARCLEIESESDE